MVYICASKTGAIYNKEVTASGRTLRLGVLYIAKAWSYEFCHDYAGNMVDTSELLWRQLIKFMRHLLDLVRRAALSSQLTILQSFSPKSSLTLFLSFFYCSLILLLERCFWSQYSTFELSHVCGQKMFCLKMLHKKSLRLLIANTLLLVRKITRDLFTTSPSVSKKTGFNC